MPNTHLTHEQALSLLAATPRRLEALTAGVSAAQLRVAPSPGEWSVNDVLAHLRACADVWGGNMVRMLAEDRPALRGMDPRRWMAQTNYPELEFAPSLAEFVVQRADLLALVEPLPPTGWSRTAAVTAWGQLYEPTVLQYAERLVIHERPHLRQIEKIIATLRVPERES